MIDGQHGRWVDATIATLMAITAGGSVPMARVALNDYTLIGRLLDDGALGIIVPMVDTADDPSARPTPAASPRPAPAPGAGAGRPGTRPTTPTGSTTTSSSRSRSRASPRWRTPRPSWRPGGRRLLDGAIRPRPVDGNLPRDMFSDDRHARTMSGSWKPARTPEGAGTSGGDPADARARANQGFRFLTAGSDIGFMLGGATTGVKDLGLT